MTCQERVDVTVTPARLPEHATVVCPICNWAGVSIRDAVCQCHRDGCGYRWRSLLLCGEEYVRG